MANGIKTGEASADSTIVWTRLTRAPERNTSGAEFGRATYKKGTPAGPYVAKSLGGRALADMRNAVPGAAGEVRVTWWPVGREPGRRSTEWLAVDPDADFTRQLKLSGLEGGTRYSLRVEGRPKGGPALTCTVTGGFRTAPDAGDAARVRFTVVTGQEFSRRDDGANVHAIYTRMLALKPDFLVHTGDIVYYDYSKSWPHAVTKELARFKWNRMYSLPFQRAFHNAVGSYFIKDDHDTVRNDCWPRQSYGDLKWDEGLAIFCEQVPMGKLTYRTRRWGRDLQVWLVEGRDFRSPNNMPDGPAKTIWGAAQKAWFKRTVRESDATFKVLISPTPLVGPDRGSKNDNHANKGFSHEGRELRAFIARQKNMYVCCGDRHWQYVSVGPESGVREYSCGPTSNKHAGGFSEKKRSPMHRYLKVIGGFLSVTVERDGGRPRITFRHHNVGGD
ncbi:MAG: alkaline phosphatase D family protein, partial [Planctomycetota bacterium]